MTEKTSRIFGNYKNRDSSFEQCLLGRAVVYNQVPSKAAEFAEKLMAIGRSIEAHSNFKVYFRAVLTGHLVRC